MTGKMKSTGIDKTTNMNWYIYWYYVNVYFFPYSDRMDEKRYGAWAGVLYAPIVQSPVCPLCIARDGGGAVFRHDDRVQSIHLLGIDIRSARHSSLHLLPR